MAKYERIEISAFRRRTMIVSGEWPPDCASESAQIQHQVSLRDSGLSEVVDLNSAEGQLILLEALRSLEERLSPETRSSVSVGAGAPIPQHSGRVYRGLQSIYFGFLQKALALLDSSLYSMKRKER